MSTHLPYTETLVLRGPDTIELLDRVVTCAVSDLETGASRPGALLTPQGKIIADFVLTRTAVGCDLAVHADAVDTLEKRLKLFRMRADVDISRGDTASEHATASDRISAGHPAFGADFKDAEIFPTDVNLDRFGGIAYDKGCFVGQEVVSRMYRRGKIRKRTLVLRGADMAPGAEVRAGKLLGKITSSADCSALAVLRIDHLAQALEDGTPVTVDGHTVTVELPDWIKDEMQALKSGENV